MDRARWFTCLILAGLLTPHLGCGDDSAGAADGGADASPDASPLPELPVRAPLDTPTDPLAGGAVESCAVYQAERCEGGTLQRCAVYDTAAQAFVDAPDPLLRRLLLYERWYDLYHQVREGGKSLLLLSVSPEGAADIVHELGSPDGLYFALNREMESEAAAEDLLKAACDWT